MATVGTAPPEDGAEPVLVPPVLSPVPAAWPGSLVVQAASVPAASTAASASRARSGTLPPERSGDLLVGVAVAFRAVRALPRQLLQAVDVLLDPVGVGVVPEQQDVVPRRRDLGAHVVIARRHDLEQVT